MDIGNMVGNRGCWDKGIREDGWSEIDRLAGPLRVVTPVVNLQR